MSTPGNKIRPIRFLATHDDVVQGVPASGIIFFAARNGLFLTHQKSMFDSVI
jgi:hypothetical protein